MTDPGWTITADNDDPIIATAIHAGHALGVEIMPFVALDEATRLREEDPFTDRWLSIADNRIQVVRVAFRGGLESAEGQGGLSRRECRMGF